MCKITLKMAREMCGYSVEEAAERCGVTVDDMMGYEKTHRILKVIMLIKLRKLYGIPLDYIEL